MQERINQLESLVLEKKAFLASTDYQSIREYEGGEPMSKETKDARAAARKDINDLQEEIDELKREMEEEQHEHEHEPVSEGEE